ncbi:hypothetical protein F974_00170 [Acinetobacter sp. CIP 102159]|nr:hypothetical protein F974_00170 [Acinetobacter sp. CIP 102159]
MLTFLNGVCRHEPTAYSGLKLALVSKWRMSP